MTIFPNRGGGKCVRQEVRKTRERKESKERRAGRVEEEKGLRDIRVV